MSNDLSAFLTSRPTASAAEDESTRARSIPLQSRPHRPEITLGTNGNGYREPALTSAPREEAVLPFDPIIKAEPAPEPVAAPAPTLVERIEATAPAMPLPPAPEPQAPKRRASGPQEMPNLGPLTELLADDSVHDILVNGKQQVFIDVNGQLQDTGIRFAKDEDVWKIAELIMECSGQRWSDDRPMIDTRLPDGSRVNIVAPPMAVDGVTISIRKFPALQVTLDSMAAAGQLTPEVAQFLKHCIGAHLNIIVAGGTSSGKTTLLNALSGAIASNERIVTIEDSAELRLQQPHVVRLESKPATSLEAAHTAVTIRDLVKNALRMRPDRIVVGESRGAEAFDVIQAMNTGHDGSMTTLHANNPRDALSRLETMMSIAMPQLPPRVLRQQIASTIHLVIQMTRGKDGTRRVTHISEVVGMEGDMTILQDLVLFSEANGRPAEFRWVAGAPRNAAVTEAARQAGILRGIR